MRQRRVPLVGQQMLTLPEHLNSPSLYCPIASYSKKFVSPRLMAMDTDSKFRYSLVPVSTTVGVLTLYNCLFLSFHCCFLFHSYNVLFYIFPPQQIYIFPQFPSFSPMFVSKILPSFIFSFFYIFLLLYFKLNCLMEG